MDLSRAFTRPQRTSAYFLGVFVLLILGGCGSLQLASRWPEQAIVVDGVTSEWRDKTSSIESKKVTIGFANDSNFVYMMLSTSDRALSRMLATQGLTVWFDPAGGRKETFGIHYPLGLLAGKSGTQGTDTDVKDAFRVSASMSELEILGASKDDTHRMSVLAAGDIQVRAKVDPSSFSYELRVPYAADDRIPFSIRAKSGSLIGVGLTTPPTETGDGSLSGGASAPSGGGGRGRGGRGGGSSMGSEPDRLRQTVEPLRDWMTVQLISPDSVKAK